MRLLLTLADYDASESFSYSDKVWSLAATAGSVFALLWVIQYAAYFVYRGLPKALNKPEYVTKFGRHTMDIISMVAFAYMGFEALGMPPFRSWDSLHTMTTVAGKVLEIGHARSYIFSASAQRLCVWQVAYQAKNFCDAVIHDDGPLFLAHHVVTGLLSVRFLAVAVAVDVAVDAAVAVAVAPELLLLTLTPLYSIPYTAHFHARHNRLLR